MKKILILLATVFTVIFIVLKVYVINDGYTYLFSAWFENVVIIMGISVLIACGVATINAKINDNFYKKFVFIIASAINGAISYFLEYIWLYFIYIQWNDTGVTVAVIRESELPYLFAIIAISTLCSTYFYLKTKLNGHRCSLNGCLEKERNFYDCNDEKR